MILSRMLVVKNDDGECARARLSNEGVIYIAMVHGRPVVSARGNPRHPAIAVVIPKKRGCWVVEYGSQSIPHQQGFLVRDMKEGVALSWGLATYRLSLCRVVRFTRGLRKSLCAVAAMLAVAVAGYVMRTPANSPSISEPSRIATLAAATPSSASRIEALMAHDDDPSKVQENEAAEDSLSAVTSDDVRKHYMRYEEGRRLMTEGDATAALDAFRAVRETIAKMPVRPPFAAMLDEEMGAAESKITSTYDAMLATMREKLSKNIPDDPWETMTALKKIRVELQGLLAEAPDYSPARALSDELARRMRSVAARMLTAAESIEEYQGCAAARTAYARVIEAAGDDESARHAEEALTRCDKS